MPASPENHSPATSVTPEDHEKALQAIGEALATLNYGTIVLTVHDSRVVQLEVTEKKRFGK